MIRALIFDFDGLILDTEVPEFTAWQEIFTEYGCSLAIHDWGKIIGGTGLGDFDAVCELEKQSGRHLDRDALNLRRRVRSDGMIAAQDALPGVRAYLDGAKRLGLRLAIASSSPHSWVETHLERLGLRGRFEAVICQEDVRHTKPDPELFLKALKTLGITPEEALIFEDSPNGIRAGKAAGVRVVAVPNALTSQLEMPSADLVLGSLADLPLEDLLLRFNAAIRQELPADIPGIREVLVAAFPGDTEARLVDLLRDHGKAILSLVAADDKKIHGHVLFTEVTLEPETKGLRGIGLAPVAVSPQAQGKGFGVRLIERGLEICRRRGYDYVVLLGAPAYYTRFGFIPASEFGLESDYKAGDAFQARELKPGALRGVRGRVHYAEEFKEVD